MILVYLKKQIKENKQKKRLTLYKYDFSGYSKERLF